MPLSPPPIDPSSAPMTAHPDEIVVADVVVNGRIVEAEVVALPAGLETESETPGESKRPGRIARVWRWGKRWCWRFWCLASLVGLLAFVTAIPLLQLASLGYLLLVSGRLASGCTLRECLPGLHRAGQIGAILTALGVASLPTTLLSHWEAVAAIVQPDSPTANWLRMAALLVSILATTHLWWAWARGGSLKHYLWPQPKRFFAEAWRPATWSHVAERLWDSLVALQLPMLVWLGARGAAGTLIWLIPAMFIMGATRDGENAVAGIIGGVSFLVLGFVMMTLPILQTHFAAENRFKALFEYRRVRGDLYYAPWAYAIAMLIALVLMPIPLYLLKVEATPQELTWLPCLVFVAFMLPARVATGLALRRARRIRGLCESGERPTLADHRLKRIWQRMSSIGLRFGVVPGIVAFYLLVLLGSQYTSWDGVDTWVRQHALLVPVPFIGI